MEIAAFAIEEMSCAACVRHVTQALQGVDSVRIVQLQVGSATVTYDPQRTSPQAIVSVLADAGYPAQPTVASAADAKQ